MPCSPTSRSLFHSVPLSLSLRSLALQRTFLAHFRCIKIYYSPIVGISSHTLHSTDWLSLTHTLALPDTVALFRQFNTVPSVCVDGVTGASR
jgi:hypothetical protein